MEDRCVFSGAGDVKKRGSPTKRELLEYSAGIFVKLIRFLKSAGSAKGL